MHRGTIENLAEILQDGRLESASHREYCRIWTGRAISEIVQWSKENHIDLKVEAREAVLGLGQEHSFVRINYGGRSYIFNGVGAAVCEPYFGLEDEAPDCLRNSEIDNLIMIDKRSVLDTLGA